MGSEQSVLNVYDGHAGSAFLKEGPILLRIAEHAPPSSWPSLRRLCKRCNELFASPLFARCLVMRHYANALRPVLDVPEWREHLESLASWWDLFKVMYGHKFVVLSVQYGNGEKNLVLGKPLPSLRGGAEQHALSIEVLVLQDEKCITVHGGNYAASVLGTRGFVYGHCKTYTETGVGQVLAIQTRPFSPLNLSDSWTFTPGIDKVPMYRLVLTNRDASYPVDVQSKYDRVLERLLIKSVPGTWQENVELSFSLE